MSLANVYIVRHGETNENRAGIIQGHRDTFLNEAGKEQAKQAIEFFRHIRLDYAFTSDLNRAATTTEIILNGHPNRESIKVHRDKALRERCLGKLEGQPLSARKHQQGFDETAESVEDFVNRTMLWWDEHIVQELRNNPSERPHEVLVVSHGGCISRMVRKLMESGRVEAQEVKNWTVYNVSITTIEIEGNGKGRLVKYSDISHLPSPENLVQTNADTLVLSGRPVA